jgi:phage terminase large subunit-like protein
MNKQKRYEQTEKGKIARAKAVAAYRAERSHWSCYVEQSLSDEVMALKPEGMTKTDYLEMIFKEYLQNH